MNTIEGDLVKLALGGFFEVIIHGCNCFCTMEAGVALAIQQEFPEAYAADLITTKGDRNKLGNYSHTTVERADQQITIVNAYTQFNYQGDTVLIDYDAVTEVFRKVKVQFSGKTIGYPRIGAGLAGGDWSRIKEIIDAQLQGENHSLVVLPQ